MKYLLNQLVLLMIVVLASCSQSSTAQVSELNATEVKELVNSGKEIVLVDVRRPDEYEQGHLQGATNINYQAEDFEQQVSQLDPNKTYVLYCVSGNRSGKAARLMTEKNFTNVYNGGGFKDLKEAGLPTE